MNSRWKKAAEEKRKGEWKVRKIQDVDKKGTKAPQYNSKEPKMESTS